MLPVLALVFLQESLEVLVIVVGYSLQPLFDFSEIQVCDVGQDGAQLKGVFVVL